MTTTVTPRWVKASDRLPGYNIEVKWRFKGDESSLKMTVIEILSWKMFGGDKKEFLEWEDESPVEGREAGIIQTIKDLVARYRSYEGQSSIGNHIENEIKEWEAKLPAAPPSSAEGETKELSEKVDACLKAYTKYRDNIQWHVDTNKPTGEALEGCADQLSVCNQIVCDLTSIKKSIHASSSDGREPNLILTNKDYDNAMYEDAGELMPCPFCGKMPISYGERNPRSGNAVFKIKCPGLECTANVFACESEDANISRSAAVKKWNTRASSSTVKEQGAVEFKGYGMCKECKKRYATKDYNGHKHYVCDSCYDSLDREFEDEYR